MADIAAGAPFQAEDIRLVQTRFRPLCLIAAITVYGLFGTPTPERAGLAEIATGLLLVAAAGGWQAFGALRPSGTAGWQRAAQALLLYGMSVPLLGGIVNGHDPGLMGRDIIPFLFLLLPLFLKPSRRDYAAWAKPVTAAIVLAGILFALRVALPVLQWRGGLYINLSPVSDPSYLANAPTVLFAALLLLGLAGSGLYRSAGFVSFMRASALAALAIIPFLAMALILQRASMGIMAGCMILLAGIGLVRSPARMVLPLLALGACLWLGQGFVAALGQDMAQKHALVGLNMRWHEAVAVFDAVSDSTLSVLFGRGWGATLASPAVGGVTVNFTHSLLTTYMLKTGLCGLALVSFYLAALALRLVPLLFRFPVLALAIAGPFFIDVFLYASFKSLDFGLLLLLIPLWANRPALLHKRHTYSTDETNPKQAFDRDNG